MKNTFKNKTLRILGLAGGYLLCCLVLRLVVMTLVAYLFIQNRSPVQDMGDFINANQVLIYGAAALVYMVLLQLLYPLTVHNWRSVLPIQTFKSHFPRGLTTGVVLGSALILGTTLGGYMQILGFFFKLNEIALSLLSILILMLSLFFSALVEEFIFRGNIEPYLEELLENDMVPPPYRSFFLYMISAFLYVAMKDLLFSLDPLECFNMGLLSLCLTRYRKEQGSHISSAGLAAGFFGSLHAIGSLPLFGQDMSGFILVRSLEEKGFGSWLSGGLDGPENGLVLSVLLLLFFFQKKLRLKKLNLDRP